MPQIAEPAIASETAKLLSAAGELLAAIEFRPQSSPISRAITLAQIRLHQQRILQLKRQYLSEHADPARSSVERVVELAWQEIHAIFAIPDFGK